MLYRGMKPDPDAPTLPQCTEDSHGLGVRADVDLPVIDGYVDPLTGGMSVVVDDVGKLPPHRLPKHRGGRGRGHVVFQIAEDVVPDDLHVRADQGSFASHRSVEPRVRCQFTEFVRAVHDTQALWRLYE